MQPAPRALLFDLDGTLLDDSALAEAMVSTCQEVAAAHPGLDRDHLRATNTAVFAIYFPETEVDWTLGRIETAAVSLEAWRRTLLAFGIRDEALVGFAHERFVLHVRESHRLYADVLAVLEAVDGRFLLGLITNGASDLQREKLRCTGIEAVFGAVLVSGEVGIAKPDERIFRQALEFLDVAPEQAWHIGDNLKADVAGAQAAGVTAVWINRNGRNRKADDPVPDVEIRSLSELVAMPPFAK